MLIRNQTKNTTLSESAIIATSFIHKTFGLILEKKADAMIFQTRFGIHTFFMKHAIDVLVLNKQKKIVAIKENLQPNRILVWNPKYETVIELRNKQIQKTQTTIGDNISFTK